MRMTWAAFGALVLLSACGQKGPLYLPDANGTVVTRPSQTQPQNTQPTSPEQSASPVDTEKTRKDQPK